MGKAIAIGRLANRGLRQLGMGSADLDETLVRFLGDVQLYAEYAGPRAAISARFDRVMEGIERVAEAGTEIHLCAHSQGSVVAFLGLLQGMRSKATWAERVRSFMTIGSPIDKFLVLWPELFQPFGHHPRPATDPTAPIRWLNFADKLDPVGHELDLGRDFVREVFPGWFEEPLPANSQDFVFRRYFVPGKAHIDYWKDQEIFDHWFRAGLRLPGSAQPVASRWIGRAGVALPFVGAAAAAAVTAHFVGLVLTDPQAPTPTVGLPEVAAVALGFLGFVAYIGASRVSGRLLWLIVGIALFVVGSAAVLRAFDPTLAGPVVGVAAALGMAQNVHDILQRRKVT